MSDKKAGFVALIGRPSVGKSTLLNKLCGEKTAIVSTVPQTTRNAIRGIVNREAGQLIFVDTPGRHNSQKKINKKLMEVSQRAIDECDIILYLIDATRPCGPEEEEIAVLLQPHIEKTIIAVNKIDVKPLNTNKNLSFAPECLSERVFYKISAQTGEGVDALLSAIYNLAPEGRPLYDNEFYTDQDVNFRITEIIREQAINRLRQELPHSLYVDIADIELKTQDKLWVRAFIIVERESQKGMVVGKGGEMIKTIRLASLKELKKIFDWKIDLDLRVKTSKDWRSNDHTLRKLIDR